MIRQQTDAKSEFLRLVGRPSVWEPPKTMSRRRTLFDLSTALHCSIIGTCLTVSEVRKALVKIAGEPVRKLNDHQLHSMAVGFACKEGMPSKVLTKILDEKHSTIIKSFSTLVTDDALREAWNKAKYDGRIEGAYWAIATHPQASEALFDEVFGDVHMLSHLAGSASRAELRRLAELTEANEKLHHEIELLRRQLREGWAKRDKEIAALQTVLINARERRNDIRPDDEARVSVEGQLQRRLHAEIGRRERAELRMQEQKGALDRAIAENRTLRSTVSVLESDIAEFEKAFDERTTEPKMNGKTILYVGGATKAVASLRTAVARWGATLLHHDGGKEEAAILLRGLVSRADIVMVSIDFVSHEAALLCKHLCQQHDKAFHPLPRFGVGSMMRVLRECYSQ